METLVALLLGLFLVQAGLTVVARTRALHADLMDSAEGLAATRLAASLLRNEAGAGTVGRDWMVDGDSLALRAFRGTGLVCADGNAAGEDGVGGEATGDGRSASVSVTYLGYRLPDPTKDSVLLVGLDGRPRVAALEGVSVGPDACDPLPGERVLTLTVSELEPAEGGPGGASDAHVLRGGSVVVRIFERGAYVWANRALRYRRGASGRQPLTPELFGSATGWRVDADLLRADLHWRSGRGGSLGSAGQGTWDDVWYLSLGVGPSSDEGGR